MNTNTGLAWEMIKRKIRVFSVPYCVQKKEIGKLLKNTQKKN